MKVCKGKKIPNKKLILPSQKTQKRGSLSTKCSTPVTLGMENCGTTHTPAARAQHELGFYPHRAGTKHPGFPVKTGSEKSDRELRFSHLLCNECLAPQHQERPLRERSSTFCSSNRLPLLLSLGCVRESLVEAGLPPLPSVTG